MTTTTLGSQLRRFAGRAVAGTLLVASLAIPGLTLSTASHAVAGDQGASASQSTLHLASTKRP